MPGWMPLTGLSWLPTSLGCSSSAASQAPPLHSSTVEEFKGTYEKDNLEAGGDVMPSKCCHMLRKKRRYNSLSENLINSRNDHAGLKLLAIVDYRVRSR